MEKFEKWVLRTKDKLGSKTLGVISFVIFGIAIVFGMNMANVYGREKQTVTDAYNRAMYELITNINNVDTLVIKTRITSTNEYNIQTLSKIMAEANGAKDNLTLLPINQTTMQSVSKYLSQVIGYSESLVKKLSEGNDLTQNDHENLKKINEVSNNINKVLQEIYNKLISGKIEWNEVEKVATEEFEKNKDKLQLGGIEKIKESLENYQGLIYDGAFSSHIETSKPKSLTGEIVDIETAAKKARECIEKAFKSKIQIEELKYTGESKGKLEVYMFEAVLKDANYNIDVQITKQDGKLLLLMSDRKVNGQKLKIDKAKKIGDEYLASLGLENLKPTYYLTTDNMVTINYAATQENVVLYPDLIKVKIALDNGDICSVECTGYIYNHIEREDVIPLITMEEAKEKLEEKLNVSYSDIAIIPTTSGGEVLTYEFKGKIEEREFLIYINAKTGAQENVLLILETPGGILTM